MMKGSFRNINVKIALAVCSVCAVLLACGNDYCKEPMDTCMEVNFHTVSDTNTAKPLEQLKVTDAVTGAVLFEDTLSSSSIRLPLAPFDSLSEFRFAFYSGGVPYVKKFIVKHKNTEEFVSAECGCRITSVIDTAYLAGYHGDSVVVKNKFVLGKYDERNVKIYWNFN